MRAVRGRAAAAAGRRARHERRGYTYTTLSAQPGEPVRVGVSFYLDDAALDRVCRGRDRQAAPGRGARRCVGDASARSPARVTAEDARIARELADQAAEYAAEVERLSAAQRRPGGGP